ncbi:hypothetical protein C2S52_006977 [Perilla frutescens var. hirtella]|nr:hypothetical protein C2S52_006977 [Perilla frutescens var. hirtella]
MVGLGGKGKRIDSNSRSGPYYSSKIEFLPDELLSEILVRLPPDDLYKRARLVCRRWSHIIRSNAFLDSHFNHSSYGLLLSEYGLRNRNPIYVSATKQGRIEISELSGKCRITAWGSCNGLVLDYTMRKASMYILNPATNQAFLLPPLQFDSNLVHGLCGIAYSESSMEYKVVQSRIPDHLDPRLMYLAVLTVGVDNSWRAVQVEHLPRRVRELFNYTPLITEGFMHWTSGTERVLAMNVETEIITETNAPHPEAYESTSIHKYYLSTGKCLTMLVRHGDLMWEVWEMKPKTGEWRKSTQFQFDCEDYGDDEFLWPVGWVKFPEVLAFRVLGGRPLIFYNLRTNEIIEYSMPTTKLSDYRRPYSIVPHMNTLVWLS